MRITIADLHAMLARGQRLSMVTAYDYTSAQLVERTDIPLILVGDSLGMVIQGHGSTLPVTVDHMVYHTAMVLRGCARPMVIADMPFLSYANVPDALRTAGRLMAEGGCQSVKLEGGVSAAPTIARIVDAGIPVMAHVGYTPQSEHQIGLRVQGKDRARARQILDDALAVQQAGAWAVVLELIPAALAEAITTRLDIPTIGIGAGAHCDGQVQVWHDVLGLYQDHQPRHARRYATLGDAAVEALSSLSRDVGEGSFPTASHSSRIEAEVLADVLADAPQPVRELPAGGKA